MESVVMNLAVSRRINLHAQFLSRSPLLQRKSVPGLFAHHVSDPEPFVA
jgi:hypothetical protein